MRLPHRSANLVAAECVEQAHTLRGSKDQIESRDRTQLTLEPPDLPGLGIDASHRDSPSGSVSPKARVGTRVKPRDQAAQLLPFHRPCKSQGLRTATCPDAGCLTGSGVVVVQAVRDGALVVALLTWGKFRDAEHDVDNIAPRCICVTIVSW